MRFRTFSERLSFTNPSAGIAEKICVDTCSIIQHISFPIDTLLAAFRHAAHKVRGTSVGLHGLLHVLLEGFKRAS